MEKKTSRFLRCSFCGIVLICLIVFVLLTVLMSDKTNESVEEISEMYMSEMNVQIQQKFTSITNLRLEQVKGIVKIIKPDTAVYDEKLEEKLKENAEIRNFTYLGLYSQSGEAERILGDGLEIVDYDKLISSLNELGNAIAMGVDKEGEKYLILAVKAVYPLKDGSKSTALIAGVSMKYLDDALYLEEKDAILYSHVIDADGTFVIRNSDAYRENYFERLDAYVEEFNGKDASQYIEELKAAIQADEDYYTLLVAEGEKRYLYSSPISEDTDWYLIAIMPSGTLDSTLKRLDRFRLGIMLTCLLIIVLSMTVVFVLYFRMSRQQISEVNQARKEAVHANQAKSDFLSSMSHDIRTPMNAIIGMTEIALKNTKDEMRVEDCLNKVRLSSKYLLGLINDVLDMSKIESGKMTLNINQMSLKETMDDLVNIVKPQVQEKNQYFDILIQKIDAEDVYCDSVRLNQVMMNVLSNAVKYTPEEGRIDIHLYQEPSPKGENYVQTHFLVKDNGIGMSEDFQKKIFESFSREESEQVQNVVGTGLGMAITKSIVDLMGGKIELKSKLGEGSEFHIILDLEKAEGKEAEMILPPWNILVVDDNEQLCVSAVTHLEELGIRAEWTTDGRKAVKMVEEHHKKEDDYHFVLLDWKMPGMDGIQVLHEIRKKIEKKIPVFLISAYDWSDIEEEALEAEVEGFVSKPLFKSTLFLCLRKYVEGNKEEMEKKDNQVMDFTGKRVLVSEDVDLNWEIAEEILVSFGLEVERAVNGQICFEKFEQSEIGFYDAILMDIRMPVMNGYDSTRAIRALEREDQDIPIIAMTADAFSGDVQYCLECGMDAHIAKPIDIKELMRTLQKYLYRE